MRSTETEIMSFEPRRHALSWLFAAAIAVSSLVPAGDVLAACKKGAELPDCANAKIAVGGKSVTIENNCDYGIRVHVDKRGTFCPDEDQFIGADESIAMDTSNCRIEYVRQCR